MLEWLASLGLPVNVNHNDSADGAEGLLAFYERVGKQRAGLPYDIDGVVYKVDSPQAQRVLGFVRARRASRWRTSSRRKRRRPS